jgi:predicted P-loop ATPase
MRLFMLGAVHRIYHPGCKFDYMLILVGGQGENKSTFLRFLCLDDNYFNDNFSIMEGDKAFEKLRGMWIVELAELTAMRRAKESESIKAFITSRVDTYRAPYNRRTEQRPRMCVLAGTSNPIDFLTDRTGNRRFLPVTIDKSKATIDIYADEIATKWYIRQAWGEIMNEYHQLKRRPKLILPTRLQEEALKRQTEFLEEDPRIGVIQEWLDKVSIDRVCVLQLWREALGNEFGQPRPQDVNALHTSMKNSVAG